MILLVENQLPEAPARFLEKGSMLLEIHRAGHAVLNELAGDVKMLGCNRND